MFDDAANGPTFRAALTPTLAAPPVKTAEDEPIIAALRRRAARILGQEPTTAEHGWMDSALLAAAGIPTVVIGPGGSSAHALVDWVDLAHVGLGSDVYPTTAVGCCR